MKLYDELKWRGLINDVSSDEVEHLINDTKVKFYIGTDPTGDSLHIGHFSSFLICERLRRAGHTPVILVGGATGLIGDPKPSKERPMISYEQVNHNIKCLKAQIEKVFPGVEIVNNIDWCKDVNFLDFLRDYGKYFNINYMLDKDIIRRRLDSGITFTEFSYMIMQALDFEYLFKEQGVTMQIAGQDQWGNITAGIELIRKKDEKEAYAFTMPLITKADGTKFGKTEGGAIWLDKSKTSSYEMYQFFLNAEDTKVIDYLKKLTFLPKERIDELEISLQNEPHLRLPHKALAEEVITFLHGHEEYEHAVAISEALFKGNIKDLTVDEILMCFKGLPKNNAEKEINLVDALVLCNAAQSKREARDFINGGGVSVNGEVVKDINFIVSAANAFGNKYTVIRRGKKNYYLIEHI